MEGGGRRREGGHEEKQMEGGRGVRENERVDMREKRWREGEGWGRTRGGA